MVVTVCALWLGRQVRIVQERKAVAAELQRVDEMYVDMNYQLGRYWNPSPGADIPLVRRLLGDESHLIIYLPTMGLEWIARAEVAFPEAKLFAYGPYADEFAFRDSLYAPDRQPIAERCSRQD